ncbi:hypothetical protein HYALB_00013973 [Hymenoscyphus albidus]|uniref:Uncharacterized protein n=1 Tax=Hymenoscyphus albidus TaxID=595503 RepID=A0A9N9LYJ1_9HELO|nr:hypothetical protein HYALB_00013973 [Hymenoscyphus albidus]
MIDPAPVQTAERSDAQTAFMNPRWSTTKKVHWASEVVDNEYKHRKLPHSPTTKQKPQSTYAMPSSKVRLDSNLGSSSSRGNAPFRHDDKMKRKQVANISKPINQTRSRSPSVKHSSKRSQSSLPAPQKGNHLTSDGPFSKSKSRQSKGADSKRGYSEHSTANIAAKRDGGRSQSVQVPKILPAVPEPPPYQRPPPAPRPGRLPTPDLDDINDREFCCCNHPSCQGHRGESDEFGGPLSKMEAQIVPLQVANLDPVLAAQAYIRDRRN